MKEQLLQKLKQLDFIPNSESPLYKRCLLWEKVSNFLFAEFTLMSWLILIPLSFLLTLKVGDGLPINLAAVFFCSYSIFSAFSSLHVAYLIQKMDNQTVDYFWDLDKLKEVFVCIHNSDTISAGYDYQKDYELCVEAQKDNDKQFFKKPLFRALKAIRDEGQVIQEHRSQQEVAEFVQRELSASNGKGSGLDKPKYLYAK